MTAQRNSKKERQRELTELFPSDHYSLRYVAWFNEKFSMSLSLLNFSFCLIDGKVQLQCKSRTREIMNVSA